MRLKVTRLRHNRREKIDGRMTTRTYHAGDTFEGTARELERFGDRLAAVAEAEPAQDPELTVRQQADLLGLTYPHNISDAKLAERVAEALAQ